MIEERLKICSKCPLNKNDVCSNTLYLDPKTNDVSTTPLKGYYKGCNCYLPSKVKSTTAHCPAEKW